MQHLVSARIISQFIAFAYILVYKKIKRSQKKNAFILEYLFLLNGTIVNMKASSK